MEYQEILDLCNEYKEYIDLMNDEVGELGQILINASTYPSYMSETFQKALIKEIRRQLKFFKSHAKIVEREESVTSVEKYKELEWD
jgi:Tfp pilus assembly PilM family ATPase